MRSRDKIRMILRNAKKTGWKVDCIERMGIKTPVDNGGDICEASEEMLTKVWFIKNRRKRWVDMGPEADPIIDWQCDDSFESDLDLVLPSKPLLVIIKIGDKYQVVAANGEPQTKPMPQGLAEAYIKRHGA